MINLGSAKIPLIAIASSGLLLTIWTQSILPPIGTVIVLGLCFAVLVSTKQITFVDSELVCYNCKAILEENAKFCASCRTPVAKGGLLECPNCKESVIAGAKFCKHCAAEIMPRGETHYSSATSSHVNNSALNSQRQKANMLAALGLILATISALACFWGVKYSSDWSNKLNAGFGSLIGQADSTYQLAQYCVILGAIGFIAGLTLFIVGMSQRASAK